jgi:hypothetical protein
VSSIIHNAPDVTTFAANVVVFLAAISAAVVGSMSAVKAIKKALIESLKPEETTPITTTQVIGGILQDQYGSVMMSEALRDNREATEDLKNAVCNVRDELRENRHTMDRLIDALRSNTSGR